MAGFHSFVVFAEMRTGSNFLESNLNALEGVTCLGEAFNPHFIGYPNRDALLGLSMAERDRDPFALLQQMRLHPDLCGFRYFHDHDPRILDRVLTDEGCAKIFLKRDVLDSYVSWKIARATGQWKLTDVRKRKTAAAYFDRDEFADFVTAQTAFRRDALRRLQVSGQTAFHLHYDDLQSLDVVNGLARYLGVTSRLERIETRLKVQNPEPLSAKVSNADEMNAALAQMLSRDTDDIPQVEIRRAALVPGYVLGARTPIVFMPVRGGAEDTIRRWMAALDGVGPDELQTGLGQRQFRQWKRSHPGHRSFSVLHHPVARAHLAFCRHIVGPGPHVYKAIRRTLINRHGLPIPAEDARGGYDLAAHRAAFAAFLRFLKENLNGQTSLRVDPAWCSQTQVLRGFAGFALPDYILREDEMAEVLPQIALRLGGEPPDFDWQQVYDVPFALQDIYDGEIEALAASAYQRDYMNFGFGPFR